MTMSTTTFKLLLFSSLLSFVLSLPQHQQQIDPSYLQQYYAQVAQAAGARAAGDATPIFEQDNAANQQPQYIAQGQQIRIKDSVAEQVRAQQQQQPAYQAPAVRQYLHQQPQVQQYIAQQPQPQPSPQQQIQYRPSPQPQQQQQQQQKQTLAITRRPQSEYQLQGSPQPAHRLQKPAQFHQPQEEIEQEEYESNPSYQFGFDVKDDEFTNYQNRKEQRDGDVIKGSYSVVDSDGFIRTVTYTADPKEGFKANVVREPTNIVVKIPTQPPQTTSLKNHQSQYLQQQPQQQQQQQQQQQYRPSPQKQHQEYYQ